ncbi:helix-turn-helix transcriptional regulator [Klebsiella pneumoniae]|uniref:HTH cro/C1-type domain-containing protein n=2 Tax=Enterobacterales TaxID=91347 RepID=A0A9N8GV32_9ENTR|nr:MULTISPECIES: helix-turn-helix transcriptional regulator [Enterobacteriaceae]ECC3352272.1 XRE family transcriptional regulator [Salmonella enterica subsp. enterica serovar Bareilly]EDX4213632.1 helix-turn-helix transcriptional regulator [Salmonella enterica subsp. enterica serovar Apapa]EGH9744917.1 helix-turn-helix transcriptional regulator [Salmonella enterica]ELP5719971.1 helix-turn-helix transcriptional regulator [Enterobacter asburiae]MBC5464447.1 helix-turn-helix transcriptional regul
MIQKTSIGEKIHLMRKAEGLSRREMSEITGISANNLKNYESIGRQIPGDYLAVILENPRFEKYTLWLMTGNTAPEAGQIAPALSLDGQEVSATSRRSARKTG